MSKEHYKIDEMYRLEMHDAELPVDSSEMWDDLALMMDKKKKKRRAIIFFWGIGVVALILTTFIYLSMGQKERNVSENIKKDVILISEKPKSTIETPPIKASTIQNIFSKAKNTEINLEGKKSPLLIDKKAKTSKRHQNKSTNPEALNEKRLDVFAIGEESKKSLGTSRLNLLKASNELQSKDDLSPSQNKIDHEVTLREPLLPSPILQLKTFDLDFFEILKPTVELPELILEKPQHNKYALSYSVAYYHPISKSLEPYSSIVFSYGQQVNLNYNITQNISASLGIEKLDIFEKFRWVKTIESENEIYSDTAFYYTNNGLKNFVGDTIKTTNTTLKTRQTANQHVLWSVPVGVNFTKSYRHWDLSIEAQAVINLKHNFEGLVAQENDAIEYNETMSRYKTNIGIMYNLQPKLAYKINARTNINLGVPLRLSSKKWFDEDQGSFKTWNAIGVQLGINVKIF